jgi:tetratricopeptide (TPR) repeat protein
MKYSLVLISCLLFSACSNDSKYEQLDKYWWIYKNARSVSDNATAINALYEIMYIDSNEFVYIDSTVVLYFEDQQFEKCIKAAKRSLKYHIYLQTVKHGFFASKKISKSEDLLLFGEFLLEAEPENLEAIYDMAVHSFRTKKLTECKQYLDRVSSNPTSTIIQHEQVQSDGTAISVPLSVSVTNLLGVYYWETGQMDQARTMFELALAKVPEYDVAKENLNGILKVAP